MRNRILVLATVIALLGVYGGGPATWAAAPNNVVKVRDYARGDCTVDDTAAIQSAINAWLSGQKTKTAGTLDFGTGCYNTSATLLIYQPDGSPVFGEIRGDGPQLATINPRGNINGLVMIDYFYGSMHGFTIDGGGGNRAATGLGFGSFRDGLGTCCGTFENIVVTNFDHCYQFGWQSSAGQPAAAEIVGINLTAQFCNVGFDYYGLNTLDVQCIKCAALFSLIGWHTDNTGQMHWKGGSSTGNTVDFSLKSAGAEFVIDGFRSETRRDANTPLIELGGTGERVTITSSQFDVTGNPSPVSIHIPTGPTLLTLVGNHLNGAVDMIGGSGSVIATHNSIYVQDNRPFRIPEFSYLHSEANYLPSSLAGEWYGSWWPFQEAFVGPGGTMPTTASGTPMPVTPTRR